MRPGPPRRTADAHVAPGAPVADPHWIPWVGDVELGVDFSRILAFVGSDHLGEDRRFVDEGLSPACFEPELVDAEGAALT